MSADTNHLHLPGAEPSLHPDLRSHPILRRWQALGSRDSPPPSLRCSCSEGFSSWHQVAAGLMLDDGFDLFWGNALECDEPTLIHDLWEHTWGDMENKDNQFAALCEWIAHVHQLKVTLETLWEIFLNRTPAEIAYLVGKPFPIRDSKGRTIKACKPVSDWTRILGASSS